MTEIQKRLFVMQDSAYKEFNSGLIPNIEKNDVIGVRIPRIRDYAKELYAMDGAKAFFSCLPHRYHEENLLHAFLIEKIKALFGEISLNEKVDIGEKTEELLRSLAEDAMLEVDIEDCPRQPVKLEDLIEIYKEILV